MKNKKSMKKTILLSAITAIAFGSIAVTTSYALFTDSAETNVTVTAGKVDVSATVSDLKLSSLDVDRTTDNSFTNGGTAVINGSSITLDKVSPGDKVTFKLAVTNSSTISTKYRTKLIAEDDDGLFEALEFSIGGYTSQKVGAWALTDGVSEATSIGSYDECYVYLPDTVGDEYQGKSCTLSFTVEAVQGNATVKNDVQYYTLSEFNALTELDDELETAYVSIGKQSLAESDVVIGNDNLKDTTALVSNLTSDTLNGQKLTVDDLKVGTVLDSGVRITGVDEQNQYHTITQKHGAKIYVSGGVYGGKDVELVSTIDNVPVLRLLVPDACDVVFNNFTVDGYFRLYTNSSPANLNSITFNKSTFNGVFQQAARIYTKLLDFEECVFNNYINTANQNNSNPIWIQTPYNLDFVMNKCVIN